MANELTIEQLKFALEIGATHWDCFQKTFRKCSKVWGEGKWYVGMRSVYYATHSDIIKIDFSPLDDYKQDKDFDIAATGGEVTHQQHVHMDVESQLQSLGQAANDASGGSCEPTKMSGKYQAYFKDFSGDDEADVYLIHHKFGIDDTSGCIHHSSKKLLLSGVRTGGKSKYQDVKEARDTLNRWLEINKDAAE